MALVGWRLDDEIHENESQCLYFSVFRSQGIRAAKQPQLSMKPSLFFITVTSHAFTPSYMLFLYTQTLTHFVLLTIPHTSSTAGTTPSHRYRLL